MSEKIGIIGGTGFYDFLKGREIEIKTPYGKPSSKIVSSKFFDKEIFFLARHGKNHSLPPHKINYLANIFALKKLGVTRIIAPCAVGSLNPKIKPGDFVICDQFINFTTKRLDTFFNGPKVYHISMAEPYCPKLRKIAISAAKKLKLSFHKKGTVIVIEGPRFSSRAESKYFSKFADIINMTQYPEVILAREMEICYLNISLVTDFDAGFKNRKDIKPVTANEVAKVFKKNTQKLKELIVEIIKKIPEKRNCLCKDALKFAKI